MTNEFYSHEDIEAYLSNQMPAAQRSAFESQIATDPLLKQEVGFQQDMISAIRTHRQNALKSRLDALEIPAAEPAFYTLPAFKWAASILVASVASIGGYMYLQDQGQDLLTLSPEADVVVIEAPVTSTLPFLFEEVAEPAEESPQPALAESLDATAVAPAPATAPAPKQKTSSITASRLAAASEILSSEGDFIIPEPGAVTAPIFNKDGNIKVPTGNIANAQVTEPLVNVDVKVINDTNEGFHYQYYNNKLFLYGNFDEQPYELLEVNTSEGKNLFMHYKGEFFKLESNALQKTPLLKIKDPKLLSELELLKRVK
jgi:hypothetical protein